MPEFIGLIAVVGAFAIPLLAIWSKHQKDLRNQGGLGGGEAQRLTDQVDALQDRVQVLERIITDRGYDVATQIEALRDTRQEAGIPLETSRQAERQR